MQIAGKAFVVTGGGSGLGSAVTERLVAKGASVLIADINAEGGESVASRLGPQTAFLRTDVTSDADGAPDAALPIAVAPIAPDPAPVVSMPEKLITVSDESTACESVAVTEMALRGLTAKARQISAVPL